MVKNILCSGLITLALVSAALADGDSRRATDDEKQFSLEVSKVFETALPEGPDGWQVVEKTAAEPPEYVVRGQEDFPMEVEYSIKWQNDAAIDAAKPELDRLMIDAGERLNSDDGLKSGMDAMEKLAKELGEAFEANDMARVEALQRQMEEIGNRIDTQASESEEALDQELRDATPRDVTLKVNLSANVFDQAFAQIPTDEGVFEGGAVFRTDDREQPGPGWHEGTTYVFMGDFKYVQQDGSARMQARTRSGVPHTSVQTIVVSITGDRDRAQEFMTRMDMKSLRALLGGV